MLPWTRKYLPVKSTEIVGQAKSLEAIKKNLSTKKPLLLYGPPGTGKTSVIHAIAKEKNLEVFELNSSDIRNKDKINKLLGSSIAQQSLFSKGKIILLDDIDALSGTKDRGGITTIMSLFSKSSHPIALTCIDPWINKLSKLRKKTILIEFEPIKKDAIIKHLKYICEQENISYEEDDLYLIAKESKGDLRSAINDLQTNSLDNTLKIEDKAERNKSEDISFCLRKIFKSKKLYEIQNVFNKVDMDTNECLLWLDENLPYEYSHEAIKKSYNWISRADVFNGRIRRWQHWRFLVYIHTFITTGVAFSKEEANTKFITYKRSTRPLKIWMANQRYAKKKSISEKIAEVTHTSKKRALRDTFPYLKNILSQEAIKNELELSDDEITWLNK
ncbi:replication factor C large subunit [archaeon]|jgi:replication factor C large subunit|nr:replication factor C large subunit [archaeon]MBT3730548.1 replication factor C large subunit [archaeon]MBT4669386.1 replication factor C large subunit [archaeon]MBT5029861.1 replication factor C large subunit [archaeon]MBT5288074.1 replication factor C large subunit [archaeon]